MNNSGSQQKQYYNQIAELYDQHYFSKEAILYRKYIYDKFIGDKDFNGLKVLDAMCGGGEASHYFMDRGAEVWALDISESCCAIYGQRFPGNHIICASMLDSGLPSESFDFIVTDSLHHLHPQVEQGMAEIIRLLKPGGIFICCEPSQGSVLDLLRKTWYKLDRRFFAENEESVDVEALGVSFAQQLSLDKIWYSGSFGYFFVLSSLYFGVSRKVVERFTPIAMKMERMFDVMQPRMLSSWVLCLFRKKGK